MNSSLGVGEVLAGAGCDAPVLLEDVPPHVVLAVSRLRAESTPVIDN